MSLAEFIIALLAVYACGILVLLAGLRRLRDAQTDRPPRVSVVIAARDEEASIGDCIDAVCRQESDPTRYEVIVADDDSADRTAEIVRERMRAYPHLRYVKVAPDAALLGKSRPLSAGIEVATGEVILI